MKISIKPETSELNHIFDKINFFCQKNKLSSSVVNLILDEIISNIIKYSNAPKNSKIIIQTELYTNILELQIEYQGVYFNMNKYTPPKQRDLSNGKSGIIITKAFVKEIFYKRRKNFNILTIFLHLNDII